MVWNAADKSAKIELSGDGKTASVIGKTWGSVRGAEFRGSGQWYFEIELTSTDSFDNVMVGFADANHDLSTYLGNNSTLPVSFGLWSKDGSVYSRGITNQQSLGSADYNEGERVGFAMNLSAGTVSVYRGTQEVMTLGIPAGQYAPACSLQNTSSATLYTEASELSYIPDGYTSWVEPENQEPDAPGSSKVSGVVQVDGLPASRTVRAFSYEDVEHTINGETVISSLSLGTAVSNPGNGEYTISLLSGYAKPVFVVAFDDYGKPFQALKTLEVGDRIHPTSPNGYVWECTSAGDLPEEEPVWSTDTETGQIYGTATMIARPFYRPMVHGPIVPEIIAGAVDDYFSSVISLVHFDDDLSDVAGKSWIKFGAAESYVTGLFGKAITLNGQAGNYLQSDSAEYALGAEDFTIEFWIYRDGEPAGWAAALAIRSTDSGSFATDTTGVYLAADEALIAIAINNSITNVGDASAIPLGQWTHMALTRSDGVARLFINGEQKGADVNVAGSIGGNKVLVGTDGFGANGLWPGMIEELRITKGVARYNGNFDVPTQAFPNQGPPPTDEHFDNVLSLMHFDGDIKDVTGRQWFATGSAEANNKQAKFGGGSLDVPANGSLYTEDVADFDFGVGDFTIEFFVYTRSINQTKPTMLCTGGSSWVTGAATLRIEAGKGIVLYVYAIPGATVLDPQPIALNTWVHVALTRENGVFRLFKNGALISENAARTTIALNMGFGGSLTVGASKYGDPTYDGCFEELRITKGVARYVAEFTPPDEPFPNQGPLQ